MWGSLKLKPLSLINIFHNIDDCTRICPTASRAKGNPPCCFTSCSQLDEVRGWMSSDWGWGNWKPWGVLGFSTCSNCTSSTAQGGGGSFKNRKTIGEVGCCESGMAERSHWWTERCLRSPLFFSLFLSFSLCFSICLAIYLQYIYLSLPLSIDQTVSLSICLSVYLSIYLSICLSICPSKTKQFCETSSMFELHNVKNEAILRDLFIFQSWQHKKRRCVL